MNSADAELLSPAFIRNIASRREAIAHEWYLAISSMSSLIPDRTGAIYQFSELADRIIVFLTEPTQPEQEARGIGEGLAELHCIHPGVIDITWKLWTRQLTDVANPAELAILYPRLVALICVLTSGYGDKTREIALAEQEQIRQALVFNVEKVSQELREYQLHLEEILDERTRELRAKEEQYRLITETSMLGIFQLDSSGSIIFANDALCNMLGYSHEELLGGSLRQLFHPDELPRVEQLIAKFYAVGSLTAEFKFRHKDGHPVDSVTRAVAGPMNNGQRTHTGYIADVTDEKQMEAALRQSEVTLRALIDNTDDTIWSIDTQHRLTSTNATFREAIAAFVGREPNNGESVFARMPQAIVDEWAPLYARALAGEAFAYVGIAPGGLRGSVYRETSFNPILGLDDKVVGVACFSRDITGKKRTEDALRASEALYRTLAEASHDLISLVNRRGEIEYTNTHSAQQFGVTPQDLIGKRLTDIFPPHTATRQLGNIEKAFESGQPLQVEAPVDFGGATSWLSTSLLPIKDTRDKADTMLVISRDVTERKRAEEALRASEERYRTLAESARDLILIIDREHQIIYINSFAADYIGSSPGQIVGQPRSFFFPRGSGKVLYPAMDSVFESGTAVRLEDTIKFKSDLSWLSCSLVPLKDSSGNVTSVFILARDISDLKRSEQALLLAKNQLELRVVERTASLASSQKRSKDLARQVITAQEEERRRVARELHDQTGQALISIKYEMSSLLREIHSQSKPARKRISRLMTSIDQTVQQIREISQDLRPPILDVAGVNLSLKEYCSDLARKTSLSIKYDGSDLPNLDAEIAIGLFRIVQELLTNVLKHAEATTAAVSLGRDDEVIVLLVEDNGVGMKKQSSRKGLGLLGVQERLDILGGRMTVHSPNGGTRITISIPWKELQD